MDRTKENAVKAAKLAKIKEDEDAVMAVVDTWSDERKASAYLYLFRSGMNMHKAQEIRARWGIY